MHTPEGYPEIYWLGMGSYDELSQACEEEYGIIPQEGKTTEEFVQEIRNEGFDIPDKPKPMSICDTPEEWRKEQLAWLFSILKDNDCEPCVENIQKQIAELLACQNNNPEIQEVVEQNKELLNG